MGKFINNLQILWRDFDLYDIISKTFNREQFDIVKGQKIYA